MVVSSKTGITTCSYLTKSLQELSWMWTCINKKYFAHLIAHFFNSLRTLEIGDGQFNTVFGYKVNGQSRKWQ